MTGFMFIFEIVATATHLGDEIEIADILTKIRSKSSLSTIYVTLNEATHASRREAIEAFACAS